MPPKRQPVSVVRAKPTPEPDELAGIPVPAPAAVAEPAAKSRTRAATSTTELAAKPRRTRASTSTPKTDPAPKAAPKVTKPAGAKAAATPEGKPESTEPAKSVQRTYWIHTDVLADVRAAVTHLRSYMPEAQIMTIGDILEPALRTRVRQLQDKYHQGKPFPRTAAMHTGRPPGSTTQTSVQVTLLLPGDLLEDLRAAVNYLYAYEPDSGILNLSSLLNPALRKRVAELERKYNNGEKFRRVTRAPTGRPRR